MGSSGMWSIPSMDHHSRIGTPVVRPDLLVVNNPPCAYDYGGTQTWARRNHQHVAQANYAPSAARGPADTGQ